MIKCWSVIDTYNRENPINILDNRNALMEHDIFAVILAEIELEIPQQLDTGSHKKM